MINKPAAIAYWRKRFDQMEAEGFALVKRIPSFEASRFPIVFGSYSPERRTQLKKLLAARAVASFDHTDPGHTAAIDPMLSRFFDGILDRTTHPGMDKPRSRAPELRRVAKMAFKQLLDATPAKSVNPGDWMYPGELYGRPVAVEIAYAKRWISLDYSVRVDDLTKYWRQNFEIFYGIGIGWWDLIYPKNVDQAFATLKEVVATYVQDHIAMNQLLRTGTAP